MHPLLLVGAEIASALQMRNWPGMSLLTYSMRLSQTPSSAAGRKLAGAIVNGPSSRQCVTVAAHSSRTPSRRIVVHPMGSLPEDPKQWQSTLRPLAMFVPTPTKKLTNRPAETAPTQGVATPAHRAPPQTTSASGSSRAYGIASCLGSTSYCRTPKTNPSGSRSLDRPDARSAVPRQMAAL
jgi:hypothetical protein